MGLASLLPLLHGGVARADPLDVRGFGVFMGYAWGKDNGFEWGFESIGTHHFEHVSSCSSEARAGFGPVLRVAMMGAERVAVTAALHGGGESTRSVLAFDGELGGTLSFGKNGLQAGVHSGLLFETIVFNLYARQSWLMSSYSMGGGIRYAPTFGEPGSCVEGRPFRDARGRARAARISRAPSAAGRSAEARRWARRAADEAASVPAFLQLAHELLELGAPLDLALRALGAAEEVLGHTAQALELASRFAEHPLHAAPPAFRPRAPLPRREALCRLARESWLDGCLNEGLAATLAAAEAGESKDAAEALVCARVAREEAGHAALAFDVLRWLRREMPALDWPRLARSARASVQAPCDGLLGEASRRELEHEHDHRWRSRFVELLDGG